MRTCIITGASSGIGAELARQLAREEGAQLQLALAARDAHALEAVALACRAAGAAVLCVPTDVARADECRRLVDATVSAFGGIDTLVNNAGVSGHARLEDVQAQDLAWYEAMMRVNFWGSAWCTHAALPWLKASRGLVVAVSSPAGFTGVPGRTAYCASKGALNGFFDALRLELRPHGVAVTVAFPSLVRTRIRQRGFDARGRPAGKSGLNEDRAMSVEECASRLRCGMAARQRTIFMSGRSRLVWLLKPWFPGLVDRMMSGLARLPAVTPKPARDKPG